MNNVYQFDFSQPVVDKNGYATLPFQEFLNEISSLVPIRGEGSPEGVYEAPLWTLYVDTSVSTRFYTYMKMAAEIGGDTSKGWELI